VPPLQSGRAGADELFPAGKRAAGQLAAGVGLLVACAGLALAALALLMRGSRAVFGSGSSYEARHRSVY